MRDVTNRVTASVGRAQQHYRSAGRLRQRMRRYRRRNAHQRARVEQGQRQVNVLSFHYEKL
jgi:hypothetical protein